ncbi:MAG: hypothetical protein SF002_18500 [Alphaproteobacteria bacterium]|nr:hypothetical protein [Alphaproteobacteria bacterium]
MDVQGVDLKEREQMFAGVMNAAAWGVLGIFILVGAMALFLL